MSHVIGVITNPTSASGRGMRWGHQALAALAARGHKIRDLTHGSWASAFEAAMKVRDDLDALVVVGGDGMVHLGAQICAERENLPLGIVPSGSGNDAANTYGLPEYEIEKAVDRIHEGLQGDVTAVDLGKVSGPGIEEPGDPRYFAAVLSAGIDAAVAAYAANIQHPKGPMKYKVATFREIARFKPYGMEAKADGLEWEGSSTLVAVANTPVFGGGLIISPNSSVTDGWLEVVVAEGMSRASLIKIFPKLKDGSHLSNSCIRVHKVKEVTICQSSCGATLPAAFADGELVGSEPLKVTVAPRALKILGARIP
ncbi:MAG: diacylglycerol kinase family lipid kinase [Demequinaceae bacterium]|nr:diacylglycerol kinase family lipid kinase [Demequinaceae bacterium]